jgi:peptide/nickel transport system substrate-binding protein
MGGENSNSSNEQVEGDRSQRSFVIDSNLTRRQILVRGGAAGAALSVSGLLAACGSSGSTTGQVGSAGGKLASTEIDHSTWGMGNATPTSLDMAKEWSSASLWVSSLSLETLLVSGNDLKLAPLLARSWSQPDIKHFVFNLQPNVKFWDGSPMTVEDVVFSLQRHMDPKVASLIGFFFVNVGSIEAEGTDRVVITMKKPDQSIPYVMTLPPILPQKFVEEQGSNLGNPSSKVTVMGTGPYEITSFTTGGGVSVVRNKTYWGKAPKVQAASLKYFESPQTMLLAMKAGEIDGGFNFPLSEATNWSGVRGADAEFLKEDGLAIFQLSFDLESEPWSDIHVRRAAAHCANPAGYVKAFLAGQAEVAKAMVPPAMWGDVASQEEVAKLYATIPQYPFDIEKAKEELAKSSFPNGFSETVKYINSVPTIGHALVSFSQALKQIGIDLTVKPVPVAEWAADLTGHKNLGVQGLLSQPSYCEPAEYPLNFFPSKNAVENAYNVANLKNPKIDQLLQEQAETTDNKERTRMIGEALTINAEECAYVPLWWEGPTLSIADDLGYNGFNALYFTQPWLSSVGDRA